MIYKMRLLESPFERIKDGTKTVEFRLYDEKRRKIKIGDKIEFYKLPDMQEKLVVDVLDLYIEKTFKDLFRKLYTDEEEAKRKAESMYRFYTPEEENEYGALGIKIEMNNNKKCKANGKLRNMTSIYLYDEEGKMLLLYRVGSRVVKNSYTGTAGGHFEKDELNDAEKCVLRELNEETGLTAEDIDELELKYVTLRYKNGEIRQNYYFFAKLINKTKSIKSNEGKLKWFDNDNIANIEMPHTAKHVINHYLKEGRKNNKLYGGIATSVGVEFVELNEF